MQEKRFTLVVGGLLVCCMGESGTTKAAGQLGENEYSEDFNQTILLPWQGIWDYGSGYEVYSGPHSGNAIGGQTLVSPVLNLPEYGVAARALNIEFGIPEGFNVYDAEFDQGMMVKLRPYSDYDEYLQLSIPRLFSADFSAYQQRRFSVTIPYESLPPQTSDYSSGIVAEFFNESGDYIEFDYAKFSWKPTPTPSSEISWVFGEGTTDLPSEWDTTTYAARWRAYSNGMATAAYTSTVPPLSSPDNDQLLAEATSPAFRFTDISQAVFSMDLASEFDDPFADRIEIELINGVTGQVIKNVLGLLLDDFDDYFYGDYNGAINGRLNIRILEDLFNGEVPEEHTDGVTCYKIRTRLDDPDGDFTSSLSIGDVRITYAMAHVPGDYNGDGLVNLADYTVWRNHLGSASARADGNNDGIVNAQDYQVWKSAFGPPPGAAAVTTTVPEPGTWVIVCLAGSVLAFVRR